MKTKAQRELAQLELDLPRKAELPEHPAKDVLSLSSGGSLCSPWGGEAEGLPPASLRLSSGTHPWI